MKKTVLIMFLSLFVGMSSYAQDTFFSDSLRKELKQYLVDNDVAWNPKEYHKGMLSICNEISSKYIDSDPKAGEYRYGIYSFWGDEAPAFGEILIRRGNEYEILGMLSGKSLREIMINLTTYFDRYPDVSKELFALYAEAVLRVDYVNSHWEGAFNDNKKRNIREYGELSKDTIYRFIEDSGGQISFFIE